MISIYRLTINVPRLYSEMVQSYQIAVVMVGGKEESCHIPLPMLWLLAEVGCL